MFGRRRKDKDFSAEIRAHLALEADRLREGGLSTEEARAAARRAFGNVTGVEERFYESRRGIWWDRLKLDVRHAFRLMSKNRALTATILLTLALGIGANSVVFGVVRAVVLRPLPYGEPDRLVQVWETGLRGGGEADWVSFPNYRDWRRQNSVFEDMAAYNYRMLTLGGGLAESLLGLQVTANLFHVLDVRPALGRTFSPEEARPGREAVAVISHGLWQRRFGGEATIAGRRVTVDGRPYTIVGVMPPGFQFPGAIPSETISVPVDLWIPFRNEPDLEERGSHNYWSIARLRADVSIEGARANLSVIAVDLARQYPDTNQGIGAAVEPLLDHLTAGSRRGLLLLLGAVSLVLLLACVNIANLLLSRAESRRREIAIREALGAGHARLAAQTLTETLLLALLGGAAGLAVDRFGAALFLRLAPANIPRIAETSLDGNVLIFNLAVSLAAGLLFGLAPALVVSRGSLYATLKEAGTRSTAGRGSLAVRRLLVVSQVALAVLLLAGAGLLIRSFAHVAGLDLGFRPERVLGGAIVLSSERYPEPVQQRAFFEEVLRRVQALPGVEAAAVANSVPLTGINDQGGFRIEGRPARSPGQDESFANRPRVSWGYFDTMRIPLLSGRLFDERDREHSPYVVVISDVAARTYWPNENPIGKRISIGGNDGKQVWREIVGIVRGTRHFGIEAPQKPEIYFPHTQAPSQMMTLVVRAASDPAGLWPAIRREIGRVDPDQAGFGFGTLEDLVEGAESRRRFQMVVLAAFACLALLLAAIGIYGVMSYTVSQSAREISVRLALGARPSEVVSMIMRKGLSLTGIGMAIGAGGALAVSRALSSLLFGVSPWDPPTFVTATVVLLIIASLAIYLPGRRAARMDPVRALREE